MKHSNVIVNICLLVLVLCARIINPDTISKSGIYVLGFNISNAGTAFNITTNNVIIDGNNHLISNSTRIALINIGLTNITVKNCTASGLTAAAVGILNGASNITVSNITTMSGVGSIFAAVGSTTNFISNLNVDRCTMTSCTATAQLALSSIASCSTVRVSNMRMTNNFSSVLLQGLTIIGGYDITVDNLLIDGNTAPFIQYPCYIQSVTGGYFNNITYANNFSSVTTAFSLLITLSVYNAIISNYSVVNNSTNGGIDGIDFFSDGQNILVKNFLMANNQFLVSAAAATRCISINNSPLPILNNLILQNCSIYNNYTIGSFLGYDFLSPTITPTAVSNIVLQDCICTNNTGNAGFTGFQFLNTNSVAVINCTSLYNKSPAGLGIGFRIGASGQSNGSFFMYKCDASYNNGNIDGNSFGILNLASINPAFVACTAVRNGTLIPVSANQISGIPAGSLNSTAYTALNGVNIQYGNTSIF